jgi:S1-C subfamily serine protease
VHRIDVLGRAISSPSDVSSIVVAQQPGATVTVDYTDAYGTNQTTTVTLGNGPAQ